MTLSEIIDQQIQYWTDLKAKQPSLKSVLVFDQQVTQSIIPQHISLLDVVDKSFKNVSFSLEDNPISTWKTFAESRKVFPNLQFLNDYHKVGRRVKEHHPEYPYEECREWPEFYFVELNRILTQYPNFMRPKKETIFLTPDDGNPFRINDEDVEQYVKETVSQEVIDKSLTNLKYYFYPSDYAKEFFYGKFTKKDMKLIKNLTYFAAEVLSIIPEKRNPKGSNIFPGYLIKAVCELFILHRGK